ncbi:protein mono-ADP-ribosyltransferase PARP14-like [Elgaria multicarinata webbii]|uniref:protein mono-ADP-ribosyltransferase PARP14-like n=1 Tax=Elgaria multicarinata webbii TaxID=159646 RepID=UPI002FCD68A9
MAEGETYLFPVLVEGNWGGNFSKRLKNKLLCYFQSQKRSGGGECRIHVKPGEEERITVYFAKEEARQRVLGVNNHELDIPEKKKLKLTVSLPREASATVEEEALREPKPSQEPVQAKEPKQPACPENVAGELTAQEDFSVVVETAEGEEIEAEILEMYFENKKRSAGGPITSCVKDSQQFIITFENKADAQEVLQRKNHCINKIALDVRKHEPEKAQEQPQMSASLVLVENVQEAIESCMLILLIENVSGLSEEDNDFSVEMVPEKDAAVITFIKPTDTEHFIEVFNQFHRVKQLKISARPLEVTKSILVENIPSSTSKDFIVVYFESKKSGGGPVLDAKYLPEENSAVITFQDGKEITTILGRKHSFDNVAVLVYPYYESLGAALYGKDRPPVKLPDPSTMSIDPYHWQFLQKNPLLLQEISHEMAACYCEIKWPTRHSPCPEIMICPLRALLKQKRSLAKNWNKDVSTQLTQILSKQKVVKCKVDAVVWEAIRNNAVKDDIFILPDIPKGIVVLVGAPETVDHAEQEIQVLIENAIKKLERERQTIEETMSVPAGKYTLLSNAGFHDRVLEYPDLKITYDASKECVTLRGVATEVFKMKSEILERLSRMDQKTVDIHPYILLFLQHVDNKHLSQLLFWAKKINAFYELKGEAVLLMGGVPQDLLGAVEGMKKDLAYKCIPLEDNSIIKKKEWMELTDSLYKACNCSNETIIIYEMGDEVVIAGCSKEVASANKKLSDFVDSNTYIQKAVKTKFAAVPIYVKQEKRNSWAHMEKQGVKIHFGTWTNCKLISLEGPRGEVLKGVELFQNLVSSLHAIHTVVDRPGAKAFFKEHEYLYVSGAKQKFNCLIRIQDADEDTREEDEGGNGPEEKGQLCCEVKLKDGVVVMVHKGDLTCFPADVVVNASNEDLKHSGGLAEALLKAAGPELQKESDEQVRKHGRLKPGCAIITSAWKLPCKQVIHAVGPIWKSSETEKCTRLLKKAVRESLCLAEAYNHCSIAIPAISSGIFGFPLKKCAHAIVTAVKETLEESSENGCLKQIYLVDVKEETVQAFSEALNEVLVNGSSPSKQTSASIIENPTAKSRPEHQGLTTPEGLKIVVQKKGIEDVTTDVVVNSVARDLQLNGGALSRALLARAGGELQVELNKQSQGKDIKEGCVLITNGHALNCSHVLHAVLPAWDQQSGNKILGNIIEECLNTTERLSLNSITIPAIGTGNLGYPKHLVAKLMFDEVFKFSQKGNPRSLQEVHFVLHPSDMNTIKAFTDELNSRLYPGRTKTVPESFQQHNQASSTNGVHKMQIGPILLLVECGDITQEATDVIVNISNQAFNLNCGVSKAILDAAGPEMATECAKLAPQAQNQLICTKGGKLRCKNVIHLVTSTDIKAQVSKVLMECEQKQFTTVAFPAIGTGEAKLDPSMVADDMIDAIIDFTSKTSAPVVKEIKIIIFQPDLLSVFHGSMQKKEVTYGKPGTHSSKTILTRVAEFFTFRKPVEKLKPAMFLEKAVEPAIFQICGESQKNVEDAASWMKDLILKDQTEFAVTDEWISNFGESEFEKLRELQAKLHIVIKLEPGAPAPSLRVLGLTRDVLNASSRIQKIIKSVREGREEQSKAELLSSIVEWRYEYNGEYKAFDMTTSMYIEAASQDSRVLEITIENKRYRVDPSNLCAVDDKGASIALRRISKAEVTASPEHWEPMGQSRIKVVELKPDMKEYQTVKRQFCQGCKCTIEKIERIQNPYYWQAYQIKKQEMDAKNGSSINEKLLFHGTSSESLKLINDSGFNRSYAGMHAAAFGNGTYFAVHASYSAQDTYSKPDANGTKYMYLARVLVGEYCAGSAGLIVPPSKNAADPTVLFDSVTDKVANPSMFIIFNDIQAYPEYLITFRK